MQITTAISAFNDYAVTQGDTQRQRFSSTPDRCHFSGLKGVKNVKIQLEAPRPEDAPKIERLHTLLLLVTNPNRTYGVPMGWTLNRAQDLQHGEGLQNVKDRIRQSLEYPERRIWKVAKNRYGEIIGFLEAYRITEQTACLRALYIHPDYQGSTAANQLFSEGKNWAIKHGYSAMELTVAPYNPAISYYRSKGFNLIPHSFVLFDEVLPLLGMSLDLTNEEAYLEQNWESFEMVPRNFFQKIKYFFRRPPGLKFPVVSLSPGTDTLQPTQL